MRAHAPTLACLLAAALFGASTPLAKALLDARVGPITLSGLFYVGAAIGVAPFASRGGSREARRARANWVRLLAAVFVGGAIGPVLAMLALQRAPAASVAIWLNLETVFTALFAWTFFGESIGWRGALGLALVIAASLVIAAPSLDPDAPLATTGAAFLLAAGACACWGLDNDLVATIDGFTPAQSTLVKGLVAGGANLGLGFAIESTSISATLIAAALAIGAVAYGASLVLYVAGSQQLGATRSQAIFATAPFWGVALAVIVLREPFGSGALLASVLAGLALVLLHHDVHSHHHAHDRMRHVHWHRHDDGHHDHDHPSLPRGTWHVHEHQHEAIEHDHVHRPDLHHRH